MASYNELLALIDAYINRNGVQAITGQILNGVLKAIVDQLGRGYTLMGYAEPTGDPGTPDGPESWFASVPGTYTNYGGIQVAAGELALLSFSPSDGWAKNTIYEGFREVTADIDGNVGTPEVGVSYANGVLSFDFRNMKGNPGEDGDPAGFGSVTASVDDQVGTPSVSVSSSGPDTAKNFAFAFHNLKGETGVTSVLATVDNTSGNPQCSVSLQGGQLTLAFTGLKGAQGNTGSSVDYPFTIVNNLTTNDPAQALSAAMGVQLESEVSQLELKVDELINGERVPEYVSLEDIGVAIPNEYMSSSTGKPCGAADCIITKPIYLEVGDVVSCETGGTGVALFFSLNDGSPITTSTSVKQIIMVANNYSHNTTYEATIEEAGWYGFSGRSNRNDGTNLSVTVTKYHRENSLDDRFAEKADESEILRIDEQIDEILNGEITSTHYSLDDLDGDGALIDYYLHSSIVRPMGGVSDVIVTKPIYLHIGDEVVCRTGGSGICLFAKSPSGTITQLTTGFTSISGSATSYSGVIAEDGWYVFSGRINRIDGTNLVIDITSYSREKSIYERVDDVEEELGRKANISDLENISASSGFALSVGANSVKNDIPSVPWFDDVPNDGTTYGKYLDDKIDSVPQGDSFIFITDVHYVSNQKHSGELIDYVRRRLGIKTVIHGGDVENEAPIMANAAKQWLDFNRDYPLRMGGDFKQVCGDHDHNGRYASDGQAFSYQFVQRMMNGYNINELKYDTLYDEQIEEVSATDNWTENEKKEYDAWKKMHYFFDDSTIKTRFIVLHTGWTGDVGLAVDKLGSGALDETNSTYLQMDFLYEALNTTPNGYNVVVVGHNVIGDKSYSVNVDGNTVVRYNVNELVWKGSWQQIAKMVRAFREKTITPSLQYRDWSGDGVQTKTYDFGNAPTAGFVFCIGGDVHWDIMGKSSGSSETLSPVTEATSVEHGIVTSGTITSSDILHILTMTDSADRGYRGILSAPGADYDDETDSFLCAPPTTPGTLDSQAFDIVTIAEDGIYFTRIGSGNDRVIYFN